MSAEAYKKPLPGDGEKPSVRKICTIAVPSKEIKQNIPRNAGSSQQGDARRKFIRSSRNERSPFLNTVYTVSTESTRARSAQRTFFITFCQLKSEKLPSIGFITGKVPKSTAF